MDEKALDVHIVTILEEATGESDPKTGSPRQNTVSLQEDDDDAQSCTRDNEGTITDSGERFVRGDDAVDSSDLGARWSALTLGAVFVPTIWPKEEQKEEEEEVDQEDARDVAAGNVREVGDDRVFWETCLGKGIQ
ncbi:hypothetical protein QJS04_geneDACA021117 [Acorus gramineus]|uniref:Uncharacterized protein n=1 Tax=Acorus gramineus TaxID=55184 RepID=A0AAV9BRL7_ACOGR|nr:hypothetical protein QJS04_geneDACA021117 [Acorus gramineus]